MPTQQRTETARRIAFTGAPGSGKTTLLAALENQGLRQVPEFARRVIRQQRLIGGQGTSDQNPQLFVDLMLARAIDDFEYHRTSTHTVLFDRAIPDLLGYAELFEIDSQSIRSACELFRYDKRVFYAPPWEEIYCTDNERTMSFEAAAAFGEMLRSNYQSAGYDLLPLPLSSVEDRAEFVLDHLS